MDLLGSSGSQALLFDEQTMSPQTQAMRDQKHREEQMVASLVNNKWLHSGT